MRPPTPTGRAAVRAATALLALATVGGTAGCAADGTPVDLTPPPGQEQLDQGAPAAPLAELSTESGASPTQVPEQTTTPEVTPTGGSSVGGVVAGFPTDLLPPYPGAEVLLTSASGSAGSPQRLDVSLAGRTPDAAGAVLEHYRGSLGAAGFAESPAAGGQGVVASVFTRSGGTEVLTVAVTESEGLRQFTVGGTLAAPAP